MKSKRILLIIPNLDFGGAQRVFRDVSLALAKHHVVVECVFNLENGHAYPSGNETHSLDVPAGKNVFHKLYCFLLRVHRLRKLKKMLKIDCAISHLEGADYCNVLSSGKEKTILCIHGSKIHDKAIRGIIGWMRKSILIPLLYRHADSIVTVAQGISDELIGNFSIPSSKVSLIHNGFDLILLKNLSEDTQLTDQYSLIYKKPVLVTHGRVSVEKNQKLLIDICAHKSVKGKANLVIIGDGPLFDAMVSNARSAGLSVFNYKEEQPMDERHAVFFLGYLSNPFSLLKKGNIFLFPSLFEGLPLALVEAMACGLPVIARDCPYGPREVLKVSTKNSEHNVLVDYGILIPGNLKKEQELEIWCASVNWVLNNPELASTLRQKSIERSAKYSMSVFENNWLMAVENLSKSE